MVVYDNLEDRIALFSEDIEQDPDMSESVIGIDMPKYVPFQKMFIINDKEYFIKNDFMEIYNLKEDEVLLQLIKHADPTIVNYQEEEEIVNGHPFTGDEANKELVVVINIAMQRASRYY